MRKYLLFPFAASDYRSAEAWLNEQAENGFRLVELGGFPFVSVWEEAEEPHRYGIALWRGDGMQLWIPPELDRDFSELEELAHAAGWRYIDCKDFMHIFEAEPEADPAPLHTDPATELGLYRSFIVRRARNTAIFLTVLIAFYVLLLFNMSPWGPVVLLSSNFMLACVLGGGLSLLWNLRRLIYYGTRLRRDKEAVREGRQMEIPPADRVYRRSLGAGIGNILFFMLLAAGILADYLHCPQETTLFVAIIANSVVQLAWNKRLYKRIKWVRFAAVGVGVLLYIGVIWYSYQHIVVLDIDAHRSARSPLLAYDDYYVSLRAEGSDEGPLVECHRFESGIPKIVDWAYAAVRKEEELTEGTPPAGYARMAAEDPAGEEHRGILIGWEGHAVLLESRGRELTQPMEVLLRCAHMEPEGHP